MFTILGRTIGAPLSHRAMFQIIRENQLCEKDALHSNITKQGPANDYIEVQRNRANFIGKYQIKRKTK